MSQEDVRAAGGPSTATMRLIEGALQSGYRSMILGRLEDALQWEQGSVAAILAGGEPTIRRQQPAVEPPMDPDVRVILRRLADPDTPEAERRWIRGQLHQLANLPGRANDPPTRRNAI